MFVVIDPEQNATYGSFVTFEEANIWGKDNMYKLLSKKWYVNAVEFCVWEDSKQSMPSDSNGDCC